MASPFPEGYKRRGNVQIPDENDPLDVSRQGETTFMDFGIDPNANIGAAQSYARGMSARRPVTQSEIGEDALMRAQLGVPDIPLDLLQFGRPTAMPEMPEQLAAKPAKPAESYGLNRGGNGKAGRGGQHLGTSQFDVDVMQQPDMSIADLRKLDDKPWELDENTNADVAAGTSTTPKPERNVVDEEPDLETPRGLYQALSKKYPQILTQNLDDLEKARITDEDLQGLQDRGSLGSLFIAASKAASGAGSIGGKTAESIAPEIVQRGDVLDRQRLKYRLDVAKENMQMNAKAVDLAMKQIDFSDEREQYDPNSEVSAFARQFMKDEFGIDVPSTVPAYQLKQFLPAILAKYQSQERAKYQAATLGGRQSEAELRAELERERLLSAEERARLDRESRERLARERAQAAERRAAMPKAEKPEKMLGQVPADVAKVEMDLAKQFRADKTVMAHQLMQNELRQLEALKRQGSSYSDQALITKFSKILDPGSVVRETEFAITEAGGGYLNKMKNYSDKVLGGGRLQQSQRDEMLQAAQALADGVREEYERKRKAYAAQGALYGARPEAIIGVEEIVPPVEAQKPSGMSPERKARLEQLRRKLRGGQ